MLLYVLKDLVFGLGGITPVVRLAERVVGVGAEGFVAGRDVDWFAQELGVALVDATAVDHETGAIVPAHAHDGARHVLVAAGDGDAGVVSLSTSDCLDAVGDDLARLQAEAHALVAHCDAVGDADGVVLPAQHALVLDGFFDFFAEVEEVIVAGIAFPPDGGDADMSVEDQYCFMPSSQPNRWEWVPRTVHSSLSAYRALQQRTAWPEHRESHVHVLTWSSND